MTGCAFGKSCTIAWLKRCLCTDSGCYRCSAPVTGARVYMLAGEPAAWLPACSRHRSVLILAT